MILVAIGSNLPAPPYESPLEVCEAALSRLREEGIEVVRRSRWYASDPVPPSDQPRFINGVLEIRTHLPPTALLERLHAVERAFGRERGEPNAARSLDLDLLAYGELVLEDREGPILPHPRMRERAFVLLPLLDIAADWCHPLSGETAQTLAAALGPLEGIEPLASCGPAP